MDPFAFFTQAREQSEGIFVRGMEEMLRNTQTLQDMSRTVELGLEGKKMADGQMKQYLELLNIPTRDDVARILQYLQKIESRVIDVEEKVDTLGDHVRMMSQALMMAGKAVAAREAAQKEQVSIAPPPAEAPAPPPAPPAPVVAAEAPAPAATVTAPAKKAATKATATPKPTEKTPAKKAATKATATPKPTEKAPAKKSGEKTPPAARKAAPKARKGQSK